MNDPVFTSPEDQELLAVYATRAVADEARQRVLGLGIPAEAVRIDDESDQVLSLRAEMHEELSQAWIVPTAALVVTKEGAKGMGLVTAIVIVIALAIAIPLAFIDLGSTLGVRLVLFSLVAVAMGGTVGFVAGAGMGSKRPAEAMAAHRGVVLRVDQDTPALRQALTDIEPIRLDEVTHDDLPLDTVVTEEQTDPDGTVEEVADNLQGDDYHPQEHR